MFYNIQGYMNIAALLKNILKLHFEPLKTNVASFKVHNRSFLSWTFQKKHFSKSPLGPTKISLKEYVGFFKNNLKNQGWGVAVKFPKNCKVFEIIYV